MTRAIPVLTILSLLQAGVLFVSAGRVTIAVGGVLALLTCNVAIARRLEWRRAMVMGLIAACIVANVLVHVGVDATPIRHRLLQVAILASYGWIALAAVLNGVARVSPRRALFAAAAPALLLVLLEGTIERVAPWSLGANVTWIGGPEHPASGELHLPNSVARTVYPDNPRGYFDEGDESLWRLETHDAGSVAVLDAIGGRPGAVRVNITSAKIPTPWFIQVAEPGLSVVGGERYELSFLARADSSRRVAFGLSMAHEPWENLGFHREVALGTEWQEFTDTVVPNASDTNARVVLSSGRRFVAFGTGSITASTSGLRSRCQASLNLERTRGELSVQLTRMPRTRPRDS